MPGSLTELGEGLAVGDLSPAALVETAVWRIGQLDSQLNAILHLDRAGALAKAARAAQRRHQGEAGPLLGIPFAAKDNISVQGLPMTCGSRILAGYRPPCDATVVARLLAAGAIPIAKANLDEFAMGSSGEYSAFGPTRNPWNPSLSPGGSSSGPVVAVAAGYVPFALGTDTGGSVRLPASFCNVTALRPTYGVLSRSGVAAMASSLDQVGPIARDAEGIAEVLYALAGQDPLDATTLDLPEREALRPLRPADLKGLKIGLPREYFGAGIDPGVLAALNASIAQLAREGAEIVEVSLPHTGIAIETYYVACTAEVSSNLSRYEGVRFGHRQDGATLQEMLSATRDQGFGSEAKRRILLGAFCLSRGYYEAFYLKALKARTLIRQDFQRAFAIVDLLATPVSPSVAFPLGEKTTDPLSMYLEDIFSVAPALAALPCLSMPAGFSTGLPVGLQLIGRPLEDVRLLGVAHAFQQITGHHLKTPNLVS
jgi:aspartyl-tRNA(Asn)/glutamyl-tRNA(Gln) amidotransferase subunit A